MLAVFASSKFFACRAELNGKYLQSVYRNNPAGSRIEASADTIEANVRTRFSAERSEKEEGLMHVRCCYNNRYWVPVQVQDSGSSRWIIGTVDEPEEDLSSPSCTLFQALPVKDNSIRFLHSGLRKFARVVSIGDETYLQLRDDGDDQENSSDNFTVVGLSAHKELPKHVAFKGDSGKYLGRHSLKETGEVKTLMSAPGLLISRVFYRKYLQFRTKDIKDASVIFTTFTNANGTVRIKSSNGGFWRRSSDDLIQCVRDDNDNDNDPDSLFEVVTGDGFVALRNLGNNKYCKTGADGRGFSYLSASDGSISELAKLTLEEPVDLDRREITDVKFHLDEARIYNKRIVNCVTDTRTNDTSRELKATFSFTKKVEMVSTWETNVSSKIGRTSKITFGGIERPVIVGGEVTISTESTTSQGQGTTESNTEETTLTQEYLIPPRTTVAVKFVATRASCDVPYSCKQTDFLTTGKDEVKVTTTYDGIYTVENNDKFHIIVTDDKDETRKLLG